MAAGSLERVRVVAKRKPQAQPESFGQRMAALRRARGLSQREFAGRLGISGRMVAYYEAQTDRPPARLLPEVARVLGVSIDQLLGFKRVETEPVGLSTRLWKRLRQIDMLPPAERKAILKILDGLLERQRLSTAERG